MKLSIVITTKNRKEELRCALKSCREQSYPHEVVLVDDASTDGTAEMVKSEYPEVRLEQARKSSGYIVQRNRAARLAKGDVIVSIDDDAAFSSSDVLSQVVRSFENERIGAVAIPYREPKKENRLLQMAPDADGIWITSHFIGTAHALRRELFVRLGGYRESLVHQGEESDFAIRLLDAGYSVALGVSDEILHFESPKRDYGRMDFFGARNQLLWVCSFTPLLILPIQFLGTLIRTICFARTLRREHAQYSGIVAAFKQIASGWSRAPVSIKTYRLYRRLRKKTMRLSDL